MIRRVLSIETVAPGPASGQASGSRPAPPPPNLAVLKVVSSHAEATLPGSLRESQAKHDAAGERADANACLKLPKGITVGVLLAIPFWALLAVWLLW